MYFIILDLIIVIVLVLVNEGSGNCQVFNIKPVNSSFPRNGFYIDRPIGPHACWHGMQERGYLIRIRFYPIFLQQHHSSVM